MGNRQFWSVFKLYNNVLSWAGILSDGVLAELVLDKLLNRYLLMSLRANQNNNDSVFKSKQIVDVTQMVAGVRIRGDAQVIHVHQVHVRTGLLSGTQQGGHHRDRED